MAEAIDLSIFGIDFADDADVHTAAAQPEVVKILCPKCNGRGKFVAYTGRVVGNCFTCNGSGLARGVAIKIADGDCVKCAGTGQWSPGRPCFACKSTGKTLVAAVAQAIDVTAISTAFAAAFANGIARPKLRLADFIFSRAPDTGRNAGAVYVKDDKSKVYLGKCATGKFYASNDCDTATAEKVVSVASDPHNAAKAYGMRTGECSCCGRTLTNGLSIDLGIGPICRGKFGWS